MNQVNLRLYNNAWYDPGRTILWRALWMFLGQPLFGSTWLASSALRATLLRIFGATVGHRVVIRQHVIVKYPWHLIIGDDCWIGEQAWIDNLSTVLIGNNVCISQGAYLCTGNHDWSDAAFGLRTASIELADGAWVAAKCILLPGVKLGLGAIASAGSVVTAPIPANSIAMGNPASIVKHRTVRSSSSPIPQASDRALAFEEVAQ